MSILKNKKMVSYWLILLLLIPLLYRIISFIYDRQFFIDNVINGHYQNSDSRDHYRCFQDYTNFFFSGKTTEISAGCLRRPTYQLLMVIPNILVLNSTTALVVFQLVTSGIITIWFYFSLVGFDNRYKTAYVALSPFLLLMQVRYSISLGPESLSLNLSILSTIYLLKVAKNKEIKYLFISFALGLLAFEVRPGNPAYILFYLIVVLYFIFKSNLIFKELRTLVYIIVSILVVPRLSFKLFGIEGGFNGGNFWTVVYGLVSPTASTWSDAYSDFSYKVVGKSEVALFEIVRQESIKIFIDNPTSALNQFRQNIFIYFQNSPIEWSTGFRGHFALDLSNYLESIYFILITVYIFISLVLIFELLGKKSKILRQVKCGLIKYTSRFKISLEESIIYKRRSVNSFVLTHNILVLLLIYYYFISNSIGDGTFLTLKKTGLNLFGFQIQGLAVLTIFSAIVALIRIMYSKYYHIRFLNLFLLATLFGGALFFGIVGHDEPMRHQALNIPLHLLLFINIFRMKQVNEEK
jgi:hypothetical protein